ncbi:aldehyde dehydrogenase family protein [Nonomuraea sp. H19]|uniref:aldehyde dehydrogenase family protein n=1 Tax=Nonomuraea sp. H19 TaxID=3452206 RepID=UPI003F8988F5
MLTHFIGGEPVAAGAVSRQVCEAGPEVADRAVRAAREAARDWAVLPDEAFHLPGVLSYYALARSEGAKVLAGGGVPVFGDQRDSGYFVEPKVVSGLSEWSRCNREEISGPVCHVTPFDTEAEAIDLANGFHSQPTTITIKLEQPDA